MNQDEFEKFTRKEMPNYLPDSVKELLFRWFIVERNRDIYKYKQMLLDHVKTFEEHDANRAYILERLKGILNQ